MRSTVEKQLHIGDCRASSPWALPLTSADVDALVCDGGPASPARRAALKAAPGFAAAVRKTSAALVAIHHGNRVLNAIINDRGRFFVTLFVLDLHFRRPDDGIGLTPGRLKERCVKQGVCSATRAGALLALMKLRGYVRTAPGAAPADRRRRELVPTAKLIAHQRARWHCHFSAAAPLLLEATHALEMLDRPDFMPRLVRLISAHHCAGFRITDHIPSTGLFSERNGGMFVVFSLLAIAEEEELRRQAPIQTSISGLARSISASRAHVIKLLKDAEERGLLKRPRSGGVILMPPLVEDFHEFFALSYLLLSHFARVIGDCSETVRVRT
ncbi:conserved protein of unknown function [Candidatus Filomicrobium marinum]|uniref:Uncharacterized protein n=1 Tax=Candidatus Filomicrobium marinum TaxID=1608628 RepID=A0A0D6JBZ2_9HYPH|nr:hypothetical protein [Candidatus Filomicrobium marinum]CFX04885.1 conserved protein of unknown function [Candidatus Filomicrobium marinum]CPR16143.1 conserved protein of unknown function [Candidatus Filomicrobium marinum]